MNEKMITVKFENGEITGTYWAIVELGFCYSKLAVTYEKEGLESLSEYYRSKHEIIAKLIAE